MILLKQDGDSVPRVSQPNEFQKLRKEKWIRISTYLERSMAAAGMYGIM